jgi:hypothetical protein
LNGRNGLPKIGKRFGDGTEPQGRKTPGAYLGSVKKSLIPGVNAYGPLAA